MPFVAGQKLRASELNGAIALTDVLNSDVTRTSSTTLTDVTGLSLALEASTTYALDGFIAYTAGATGDLKMSLTVPSGVTGSWGLYGLSTSSTGSTGDVIGTRITAFGDANTATAGGSDSFSGALMAPLRGVLIVSTTAGTLQPRFAQNTSSGTSTVIKAGTWIRIQKIT